MDLARGRYYTLNSVGSRIWELVEREVSVSQIVEVLQQEYSLPPDDAEDRLTRDVRSLLSELRTAGLVVESPTGVRTRD